MTGFRSRKKTCSNFQFGKKQRLNSAMTLKTARKSQTSPEETPNSSRHWRIWRENRSIASEHLLSIAPHQLFCFRRWGTPWNTCNICRSPWAIWAKVVWSSVSSRFGMDFKGKIATPKSCCIDLQDSSFQLRVDINRANTMFEYNFFILFRIAIRLRFW